ncbi:MAG: DNA double-strand break repair nuclease NurA [Anaerolineales bacterium]|nr:DNA double-strand break repair nuclease NurA [Anaerolineales bacterium]
MALDFQRVREQVIHLGKSAPQREQRLNDLREQAQEVLESHTDEIDSLRQKVQEVVRKHDPSLRCAMPADEPINGHYTDPVLPQRLTLLAADGSQIYLDRHEAVEYFLINIGTIQMSYGQAQTPSPSIETDLYYGDQLYTSGRYPSEEQISLMRDLRERQILAEVAEQVQEPLIALTDGPLEIWGLKSNQPGDSSKRDKSRDAYLENLSRLQALGAATAGYVDKPSEDFLLRLLEIAAQPAEQAKERPFFGVRDADLFYQMLAPGERSAVFEIQSRSAGIYKRQQPGLALHFFYLNVGRPGKPWLARVDIPGWVAGEAAMLNNLHAVLVDQCRIMGTRPYPYLLQRAHETALVSRQEKEQVTQMIILELRQRGIKLEGPSQKQASKDLPGRTSYKR